MHSYGVLGRCLLNRLSAKMDHHWKIEYQTAGIDMAPILIRYVCVRLSRSSGEAAVITRTARSKEMVPGCKQGIAV